MFGGLSCSPEAAETAHYDIGYIGLGLGFKVGFRVQGLR